MEAAPRLPMIAFNLFSSTDNVQFSGKLKQYIASFYNEDPESYITEISKIESLRAQAVHPSPDISGIQLLKKYYCQLHFLKSRFPMDPGEPCFIEFEWRDLQNGPASGGIHFELMAIMHNIGVLHTYLGTLDTRSNPEGMKLACSHFQCAAWAFETLKEKYSDALTYLTSVQVPHFYRQVCLGQAQECILEKSMLDNRKSTIIAKVAVQVWDYYRQALSALKGINEDVVGQSTYKEWMKFLQFKIAYHRCISLLFQGQQAEELQKMGERVAFYQAACDHLEEARKCLSSKQQKEMADALSFTADVVEGKRKAAKNENELIYHEKVPDIANLQEVKGASLVKGIEFSVNDSEVSGPDIFSRLVPMEAHEAASLYSEKRAQLLRSMGEKVEIKDQALAEFMSSMQLDMLIKMHQATGIPQEIIDRAAALSAKPTAIQELVDSMAKLSNVYHDVAANLTDIDAHLKEEEENERNYQEVMGKRPPSIITTDLAREASKYKEAHAKANESNQTLSKAMMTHLENLKILQRPIRELQQNLPSVELPDANIDQNSLKELEMLNSKVDEMKTQRAMLWAQLRDAVHNDDITNALVTKQPNQSLDELFNRELEKHTQLVSLIEQNLAAQENITKAFVDCYAKTVNTRRYIQDIIQKRSSTIQALIASYDSYDDLLSKANKGVEFYTKLDVNVSKLLQRIKSASNVQQEEREQMLSKNVIKKEEAIVTPVSTSSATAPKLKDYLEARKKGGYSTLSYAATLPDAQNWPPGVRPAPLGSEITSDPSTRLSNEAAAAYYQQIHQTYGQTTSLPKQPLNDSAVSDLTNRMGALLPPSSQYSYSSYTPQNYTPTSYTYPSPHYTDIQGVQSPAGGQDVNKAFTTTKDTYQTISSFMSHPTQGSDSLTHMQYPDSNLKSYQSYLPQSGSQGSLYQQGQNLQYPQYLQNQQHGGYPTAYSQQYQNQNVQVSQASGANTNVVSSSAGATYNVYPSQYSSDTTGTTAYSQYQSQNLPISQATGTNVHLQTYGSNTNVASTSAGAAYNVYPNQYSAETSNVSTMPYSQYQNSTVYTQASAYTAQQSSGFTGGSTYYPQGYAPNYSPSTNPPSQNAYVMADYSKDYYTHQHASSVTPGPASYNSQSTYSAPGADLYKVHPGSANSYNMSTGLPHNVSVPNSTTAASQTGNYYSYGSVYGYGQANYAVTLTTNSYTYPTTTPQTSTTPGSQTNVVTNKESNVDLLTGLDFSVSHIPTLTPQQNIAPEKPVEPEPKSSVVEIKPPTASPKVKEEPKEISHKETIRVLPSKPLSNGEVRTLFTQEIEKYEKYVEMLTSKTLNGPTTLDVKWKEIQDSQELDSQKRIISVARCYPMKNRFPDILPYDYSRVELSSTGDDYINASFIKQLSPFTPQFIVTQAPLASTCGDFWAMVREQQVELIFCLLNDSELGDDVYWPKEKGKNLTILNQNTVLSLQSIIVKPNWTERLISIAIPDKRESRVVMHVQFTSWPGSLFPTSPEPFVSCALELISLFEQQKFTSHPVLVHCASGIGRSGVMCLLVDAILNATNQATLMPDLAVLTAQLGTFRRNILRDREHLKFAYEAMLCYMKQVLLQENMKKKLNEVVTLKEEEPAVVKQEVSEPIDPLSSLDPFWASKK